MWRWADGSGESNFTGFSCSEKRVRKLFPQSQNLPAFLMPVKQSRESRYNSERWVHVRTLPFTSKEVFGIFDGDQARKILIFFQGSGKLVGQEALGPPLLWHPRCRNCSVPVWLGI